MDCDNQLTTGPISDMHIAHNSWIQRQIAMRKRRKRW